MPNSIALRKAIELLVIGLVHRQVGERHVQRDMGIEGDELLRQPRPLGILDERLAPLLLLDLGRAREQRFEIAVFADELRRGLDADARHARAHCRWKSPIRACTSITFSGGTPNFSTTSGMPILRSFIVSYMTTQSFTSCIRSLSEDTMVALAPASQASRT